MWLITVQHNQPGPERPKMCHFRRQKHDIMMPKATPGSNSIYWNVSKRWLATKHKSGQSLFSPKAHILWSLWMSFEPAEHLAHEAEYQNVKAAHSCFKSLFSFCLFVFCFSRSPAFLSADKLQLSVTWLSHLGSCYTSHLRLKPELTRQQVRLNPDAVIQG